MNAGSAASHFAEGVAGVARLAALAALAGLALLAVAVSVLWSAHANALRRAVEVSEARSEIVHLDEVLTMSAFMAAATGESGWESRHIENAPKLDAALLRAQELTGELAAPAIHEIDLANQALLEMEHAVFALARASGSDRATSLAKARTILNSDEYHREKDRYKAGTQEIDRLLAQEVATASEAAIRSRLAVLVLMAIASFAALVTARVFEIRLVGLRKAYASMEAREFTARRDAALTASAAEIGLVHIRGSAASLDVTAARLLGLASTDGPEGSLDVVQLPPPMQAAMRSAHGSRYIDFVLDVGDRSVAIRGTVANDHADLALFDVSTQRSAERTIREYSEMLTERVRERTTALSRALEQNRQLTIALGATEQAERRRLAYLLHEDVQQLLAAVRMHVSTDSPQVVVLSLVDQAIGVTRNLSHDLTPPIEGRDLADVITDLCARAFRLHGLQVHFEARERPIADRIVIDVAHGVVRELMFNVVKHAGVTTAEVDLQVLDGRAVIDVSDNGHGINGTNVDGLGLTSARLRVLSIGGALSVDPMPGSGTRVRVILPLEPTLGSSLA